MKEVVIFTDGGCSGNPGPGGYAFIVLLPDREIVGSGGEAATTNNRMELRAVIAALEEVERASPGAAVVLNTDSQYVKNGITSWINSWKRNGWRTADKKAVKNRELWEELDAVAARVKPAFKWVKGHAGIEQNERCDAMVQAEIRKFL
jgi:ribonuclease HI